QAGLTLSGKTLYGTAAYGGHYANGVVFSIKTDATGFTNLHSFGGLDGAWLGGRQDVGPDSLILSGNTLYGTTRFGGSSGNGTIFSIALPVSPPQLATTRASTSVVLTWPTNATGFTL